MTSPCWLIGDIGGTNARFALARRDAPGYARELTLSCAAFETAGEAVGAYLEKVGATAPDAICFAVAGPVVGQRVRFTNSHWQLASDELGATFGTDRVRLLNDFEAIAWSLPYLRASDCIPIGLLPPPELAAADFTVGVIGPGTGLGAAGLLKRDGRLVPVVSEAGHIGFAPETRLQMDVLVRLREEFDRVSDERLLSGPGLGNIHRALSRLHGEPPKPLSAAEICERAATNGEARAAEALQLFYEVLGQVAGNLALALGAADGVYLAGGIVKRKPELLGNSRFRTGFERKGRHRSLMERIPTQLIVHPQPGLLGAACCARQLDPT